MTNPMALTAFALLTVSSAIAFTPPDRTARPQIDCAVMGDGGSNGGPAVTRLGDPESNGSQASFLASGPCGNGTPIAVLMDN